MAEERKRSSLMKMPELFAGLPGSVCRDILSRARPRDLAFREVIFLAGDPIKEILLLTEGCVKITQLSKSGSEVILRLNVPGQVIGSLGLVPGSTHSTTAQTLQACKVLVWDAAAFEAALERYPRLYQNAEEVVARQICELSRRFCEICTGTVSPRLAHGLIRLLDQIGRKVNGDFEIDVTQQELGQMTAMTLFTLNRQLCQWEKQGLVRRRRHAIVIRDVAGLVGLCNAGGFPAQSDDVRN